MAGKAPDAFRTISEAAEEIGVPAHVLRFWESRFPQISPLKRAGGRRFYRPNDLALLRGVKRLLYEDGFTIKGAKKFLRDHGVGAVVTMGEGGEPPAVEPPTAPAASSSAAPAPVDASEPPHSTVSGSPRLASVIADLEAVKARLDAALEDGADTP